MDIKTFRYAVESYTLKGESNDTVWEELFISAGRDILFPVPGVYTGKWNFKDWCNWVAHCGEDRHKPLLLVEEAEG